MASWHGRPARGKWELRKNRSAGFQPAEGPLKCNDLYAGETPALQFFTLRSMKSLAINSELPHTSKSVTGETPAHVSFVARPSRPGKWGVPKNRRRGFPAGEGPLKWNDLYAGEAPALPFFTLRGMKSLA